MLMINVVHQCCSSMLQINVDDQCCRSMLQINSVYHIFQGISTTMRPNGRYPASTLTGFITAQTKDTLFHRYVKCVTNALKDHSRKYLSNIQITPILVNIWVIPHFPPLFLSFPLPFLYFPYSPFHFPYYPYNFSPWPQFEKYTFTCCSEIQRVLIC